MYTARITLAVSVVLVACTHVVHCSVEPGGCRPPPPNNTLIDGLHKLTNFVPVIRTDRGSDDGRPLLRL